MFITKKKYQEMLNAIAHADDLLIKQNRMIVKLNEENRHLSKLVGLYEACLNKGVKVDFPGTDRKGDNKPDNNSDFIF